MARASPRPPQMARRPRCRPLSRAKRRKVGQGGDPFAVQRAELGLVDHQGQRDEPVESQHLRRRKPQVEPRGVEPHPHDGKSRVFWGPLCACGRLPA